MVLFLISWDSQHALLSVFLILVVRLGSQQCNLRRAHCRYFRMERSRDVDETISESLGALFVDLSVVSWLRGATSRP